MNQYYFYFSHFIHRDLCENEIYRVILSYDRTKQSIRKQFGRIREILIHEVRTRVIHANLLII